jgi:hypothetical protein
VIVVPKALNSTTIYSIPRNSQNKVFLAIFPFVILTSTICHSTYLSVLDFFKSLFHEIDFWIWFLNLIFASYTVKIKFEIDKKSSSKINFMNYRFKKIKYRLIGGVLWRYLFSHLKLLVQHTIPHGQLAIAYYGTPPKIALAYKKESYRNFTFLQAPIIIIR